jgi:hypothetical protein
MKRHYEIMRVMRTKIPDPREIYDSEKSIRCVYNAVQYRVDDLTSMLFVILVGPVCRADCIQTSFLIKGWILRNNSKTLRLGL